MPSSFLGAPVGVATWNCCGKSLADAEEWEPTLSSIVGVNTIVGVQEAQHLKVENARKSIEEELSPDLSGFAVVPSRAGHSAVLIPTSLTQSIRWRSDVDPEFKHLDYASAVCVGSLGVVSCYFVHLGRDFELFRSAVDECERCLRHLRFYKKSKRLPQNPKTPNSIQI